MRAWRLPSFLACARALLCALAGLCLYTPAALAHKGSDAYLAVSDAPSPQATPGALRLNLALAIKDLDLLLPLDANADGKVTWGEVRAATPAVLELLQSTTSLGPSCPLQWSLEGLERRSDGAYMRLVALAACPADIALGFRYTLFREQDATHRLIVTGRVAGRDLLSTISPQQAAAVLLRGAGHAAGAKPEAPRGPWMTLLDYLSLGMHHLWEGYDHMAFLLALVLPLRLRFGGRPVPATNRASASGARCANTPAMDAVPPAFTAGNRNPWWELLRTITAFTIGHSITLMLATFGWTQASPVWVEPVIAASIGFTAWLNIRPVRRLRVEWLALGFGMVHGFGFAGLLQEAAAPTGLLPWALAGFNLGVEVGQLSAVTAWVLLSQLVVRRPWYGKVVVRGGSAVLIALSLWWFLQRLPW